MAASQQQMQKHIKHPYKYPVRTRANSKNAEESSNDHAIASGTARLQPTHLGLRHHYGHTFEKYNRIVALVRGCAQEIFGLAWLAKRYDEEPDEDAHGAVNSLDKYTAFKAFYFFEHIRSPTTSFAGSQHNLRETGMPNTIQALPPPPTVLSPSEVGSELVLFTFLVACSRSFYKEEGKVAGDGFVYGLPPGQQHRQSCLSSTLDLVPRLRKWQQMTCPTDASLGAISEWSRRRPESQLVTIALPGAPFVPATAMPANAEDGDDAKAEPNPTKKRKIDDKV
ncbi:hypothetical protein PG996_007533 [Apiospora saccharicola]|uniref:Uncharacterized protein n=1 Tax=Apiospora saccharicola TaxID=335842 RepID=A0ABR1VDM1_9PEZI